MRLLKKHVLLRLVNSYLVDSPEPANISYLWNFGSLLGFCLVIQILTGSFLAMHYQPNIDFAFTSVEHIMRNVNNGAWWNRKSSVCLKLSNSGDTLKLLIQNYKLKAICFLTYNSSLVKTQKIDENLMGNRGSKSKFIMNFVKAQRVDDSLWNRPFYIRYTLKDFERNYQLKNLSTQLNLNKINYRNYTSEGSVTSQPKFNPWFVTGLIDGEGSFTVTIYKSKNYSLGWAVQSSFQIELNQQDLSLLKILQEFFGGVGRIIKNKTNNSFIYRVTKLSDLINVIFPHFEKYPLLTQKGADLFLLKKVVEVMNSKEHLKIVGLQNIVNIRASMNWGLSDLLKSNFTNFFPVERPIINTTNIPDPNWLAGFVSGEGCFFVQIKTSKTNKIGHQVQLGFTISQHERDKKLMEILIKFLETGKIYINSKLQAVNLTINKFEDINKIIIPFFNEYQIKGKKK